jgi:hypothetical protein
VKKIIAMAAALALLALSCGDEEGVTPQEPDRLAPTSPANVLKNVELAFNNRDVDLLKAMLSLNFIFYFDPDDVGQNPPGKPYIIPESWSYTVFWQAVYNMFTKAHSISLSMPTGEVGTPGENETTYRADKISVSLLVMVDELNGYIADNGHCNYEFESYTSEAGKKCWRLTKWWDRTSGAPADVRLGAAPTSLGKILSLFR